VEFALVAPILLLILAAVIDIGSATYVKRALDERVTAAAEYALMQSAPADQEAAEELAEILAGIIQGDSETVEVVVNNAATGDPARCYCPTGSAGDFEWGSAMDCATSCPTEESAGESESAGQFVLISASTPHISIFPGYAFIEGDTVNARAVVRLQ
jgi:Flp pilus assembly protein TadG